MYLLYLGYRVIMDLSSMYAFTFVCWTGSQQTIPTDESKLG